MIFVIVFHARNECNYNIIESDAAWIAYRAINLVLYSRKFLEKISEIGEIKFDLK